ncbi:synaptotagmin-14-like isoform X2 [Ptychodera flava]|uniref:synaptotagmin-14-like isoform X2 n=1 Tax=Ptychodera flava TaxID=63121 RepID=UPI003969BF36
MRTVPVTAISFLGAIAGCLLLLVVLFLYLNKQLCFKDGCPCVPSKDKKKAKKLGDAYGYEEDESSSDESDDEMLLKFQQSLGSGGLQRQPSIRSVRGKSAKSPTGDKDVEHGVVDVLSAGDDSDQDSVQQVEGFQHSHFENEGYDSAQVSQAPSLMGDEELGSMPALAYGQPASPEDGFAAQTFESGAPELISKCGEIEVTFAYNGQLKKMTITLHRARNLPSKERGGASHVQVRMVLLPAKKQRCKTKIKQGENPEWKESFRFARLPPHELSNTGLRFRLYGTERMRKERLIGECVVKFSALNTNAIQTIWLQLEPRSNLGGTGSTHSSLTDLSQSDSGSSTHSLQHGGIPELLVGLSYNSTTGRLAVEVIKGSHFRNMAMTRPPDTYVKIALMASSGFEMTRSKTSVRRGQPNPTFKETFIFQVAQFQLPDVTVMFSVYNKRSMKKKEMFGWFSMGLNNSSEEELAHWNEMRESKGHQVCRWHVLLES